MANELVALEQQLAPLAPRFAQVLPPGLPVERLIRTVLVSCERTPKLYTDCDRQSLFNAAMTAAVLGLEVDGATGQAFLIPFKNRAQLVIGYKGFNTLAARSGITITGGVVREGDEFDFDEGEGWVRHKRELGNEDKRRIVGAWAKASAHNRPAVVKVLSIDELMAVKKKSPGARRDDSPWNDPQIGFPAMCEKTAKRRLARSMPLNIMQTAARMDEAFDEQGAHSYIDRDKGLIVEGEYSPIPEREHSITPTAAQLTSRAASPTVAGAPASDKRSAAESGEPGTSPSEAGVPTAEEYSSMWDLMLADAENAEQIKSAWQNGKALRDRILWPGDESAPEHWSQILKRANAKRASLTKGKAA